MKAKKIFVSVFFVSMLASTVSVFAAGSPDTTGRPEGAGPPEGAGECAANGGDNPRKPGKVRIAHCGCNSDGTDLVWKHIRVSTKAVGHLKHQRFDDIDPNPIGCVATNTAGEEVEILHKRSAADCRLVEDGNDKNIGTGIGLGECPQDPFPETGTSCSVDGSQAIPEPEPEPA
jgi:hypothetical protein